MECFEEKGFLFRESFFCYHFWSLSDFFVFLHNCLVRCTKPQIIVQREINGKINLEKLFSLNNFGIWAEKTWTFSKTVRHDFQNRSLPVQMTIFRIFVMEAKLFEEKFSVFERKHRFSGENDLSGLSKADFKCPVQHFEKKLIKVNFTFCGLFRTVFVFFCSERKVSQGFQNDKLRVKRKNLGRIFLMQMLFQNIFSFWAEKFAVLAKNYRHGCQNCKLHIFGKFWGKTVFFQNWIANLFGLWDEKNSALVLRNFLLGFYNKKSSFQWNVLRKKDFSFEKVFSVIIFGVWVISLSFCKIV